MIRRRFPRPEKGWQVYVENLKTVFEWDGAVWKEIPKTDFTYFIAKAAKEFGWTAPQIMDLTVCELKALFRHLPRLNLEAALPMALAFNDPQKIQSELESIYDENLSPLERWDKGIERMKEAMRR